MRCFIFGNKVGPFLDRVDSSGDLTAQEISQARDPFCFSTIFLVVTTQEKFQHMLSMFMIYGCDNTMFVKIATGCEVLQLFMYMMRMIILWYGSVINLNIPTVTLIIVQVKQLFLISLIMVMQKQCTILVVFHCDKKKENKTLKNVKNLTIPSVRVKLSLFVSKSNSNLK